MFDIVYNYRHLVIAFLYREVAGYKFIGCPKCIEDNKYDRNAFMFNFVFVFDSTIDTSPYEAVVLKIGNAFKSYEVSGCVMHVHVISMFFASSWG